jgi:hypothetical protein
MQHLSGKVYEVLYKETRTMSTGEDVLGVVMGEN